MKIKTVNLKLALLILIGVFLIIGIHFIISNTDSSFEQGHNFVTQEKYAKFCVSNNKLTEIYKNTGLNFKKEHRLEPKFFGQFKQNEFASNHTLDNSTNGNLLRWTFEKDSAGGFIVSLSDKSTNKIVITFALLGILGTFSIETLLPDKGPETIAFLKNPHSLKNDLKGVFSALVIIAMIMAFLNLVGSYNGIFIGYQIYNVNMNGVSVSFVSPLINTNPAPGFIPFGRGEI